MAHVLAQRECTCYRYRRVNFQCYFLGIPAVAIPIAISFIFVVWKVALRFIRTSDRPDHGSRDNSSLAEQPDNVPIDEKSIGLNPEVLSPNDEKSIGVSPAAMSPDPVNDATEERNVSRFEQFATYGLRFIHSAYTIPEVLSVRTGTSPEQNGADRLYSGLRQFCMIQVAGLLAAALIDNWASLAAGGRISRAGLSRVPYMLSPRRLTLCAAWLMLGYNGGSVTTDQSLPLTMTVRGLAICASVLGSLLSPSTTVKDSGAGDSETEVTDVFSAAALFALAAKDCLPEDFGVYYVAGWRIPIWSIIVTFILLGLREILWVFHEARRGSDFVNALVSLVRREVSGMATEWGQILTRLAILATCFVMSSWTVSCLPWGSLILRLDCTGPTLHGYPFGGMMSIMVLGCLDWKDSTRSGPLRPRDLFLECVDVFGWTVLGLTGFAGFLWGLHWI